MFVKFALYFGIMIQYKQEVISLPANLNPQYYEAEEAFRNAKSIEEKIAALEEMLAVIPKHKGTDKIQADIKKRISNFKKEGKKDKGGNRQDDPYIIESQGAGQVVLIGFPNCGKSTLVKNLTNARVKIGSYPFTTPLPQPGMMPYEDIKIQLIDTPPLTEEGIPGPFLNTIRNGNMLLLFTDLGSEDCVDQLQLLLNFLQEKRLLRDKVSDAGIAFTEEDCQVIGSKSDLDNSNQRLTIIKELITDCPEILPISVENNNNIKKLRTLIFQKLGIIRVYAKSPGKKADKERPFVLKKGSTVIDFAREVHRDIVANLKEARVWGSARFDGQAVSQDYQLKDKDIVELNS